MKKSVKKGFTIVELVIVIAVIAILAAVLIPTFSSLIEKANESSDIQAVREMNIALMNEEALTAKSRRTSERRRISSRKRGITSERIIPEQERDQLLV